MTRIVSAVALVCASAPPGNAASGRHHAATLSSVSLELVRATAVTEPELDAIRDQIVRIWREEEIEVGFGPTHPSQPGEVRLRLILSGRSGPSTASPTLCALGAVQFQDGAPEPELTVFVNAVRAFVRHARPMHSPGVQSLEAARIMGRVAAHEIGHYLLADQRHQPKGLMQARFDGAELLGPNLKPFKPPLRSQFAVRASR